MGAVVDRRDQADRFIDEGVWEYGFDDDRIAAQVRIASARQGSGSSVPIAAPSGVFCPASGKTTL